MAYPPALLPPTGRSGVTPLEGNHADDHNRAAQALADLVAELGSNPSGDAADLTARLTALAADVTSVRSRVDELVLNVRDYGAKGDGTTDDRAAILAAIAAAPATGAVIYFPAGDYRVAGTLTLAKPGVSLVGAGSGATTITYDSTADGTFATFLNVIGPALAARTSPTTTLTADAVWTVEQNTAGVVLSVASTAGLSVGDLIVLGDDFTRNDTGNTGWHNRYRGELHIIAGVDAVGNKITTRARLKDDYLVSRSAGIHRVSPIKGNRVENLRLRNRNPQQTSTRGVLFGRAVDVRVSGVVFEGFDQAALEFHHVHTATVVDCTFRDLTDQPGAEQRFGYGIAVGSVDALTVSACTFLYCRHGVTTTGTYNHRGWPRNVLVVGCTLTGTNTGALDTHLEGSDIAFVGNHVSSINGTGINVRSARTIIIGNRVAKTNAAVAISGDTSKRVTVIGNVFEDNASVALQIFSGSPDIPPAPSEVLVKGNTFRRNRYGAVSVAADSPDVAIVDNYVADVLNGAAFAVGNTSNPPRLLIMGNLVERSYSIVDLGSTVTGATVCDNRIKDQAPVSHAAKLYRGTASSNASNRLWNNHDVREPVLEVPNRTLTGGDTRPLVPYNGVSVFARDNALRVRHAVSGRFSGFPAWFDVKAYGAKGDGVTDDTSIVRECLQAAHDAGGGTVYFPAGTYLCQDLQVGRAVTMQGEGPASVLKATTGLIYNFVQLRDSSIDRAGIRDLVLDCTGQTGGNGISLNNTGGSTAAWADPLAARHHIENVELRRPYGAGIYLAVGPRTTLRRVTIDKGNAGNLGSTCFAIDAPETYMEACTALNSVGTGGGFAVSQPDSRLIGCRALRCGGGTDGITTASSGFGISITAAAHRAQLVGCAAIDCGGAGFALRATGIVASGLEADSCHQGYLLDNAAGNLAELSLTGFTSSARIGGRWVPVLGVNFGGRYPIRSTVIGAATGSSTSDVSAPTNGAHEATTILVRRTTGSAFDRVALDSGLLYTAAGALTYRGSSGTVTTIAPA